ncbi:MAG TPA: hypothetical protein VGM06_09625 [Polyangiaceae bacterium]|jgi:hypothetical protein
MAARPFALRLVAALAFLAAGAPLVARATPTFPGDVEVHYGLNAVPVDPPTGCRLCHDNDDLGGDPTTLRAFGRLLYDQLNVQPYDDASLQAALGQLDTQYTNLADDIATGKDPNLDLTGGEGGASLNLDPVPMYGCAVGPGSRAGGSGAAGIFAVFAAIALYRPRRRRDAKHPRKG